jgi:tetratricopeptide (TPR) repeat protein
VKIFIALFVVLLTSQAYAQSLTVPEASPAAAVEQTVGITQLRVTYHRPAVAGRKVWGEVVPYGEIWRVGANENTTLSVSTPVKIGTKTLAAGTYGLHLLPTEKAWTLIVSNQNAAWGSYGYDAREDAVRVGVTPEQVDASQERLSFHFDDLSEAGVTLVMRWEKMKIVVPILIDTPAVVMANMKKELRGAAQFRPEAWEQAARYFATHGGSLEEAARMADRALSAQESFKNMSTRALIAEKKGDAKLAAILRTKAETLATEADFNRLGYELLAAKKLDEAINVFLKNAQTFPTSWNAFDSLAEAYLTKGDKLAAAASYRKALSLIKDPDNKKRIEQTLVRIEK